MNAAPRRRANSVIEWLGIACVAWTGSELIRLALAALRDAQMQPLQPSAHRNSGARQDRSNPKAQNAARARRFAAWDDRGRPIDVEDLGHRR